MVDAGAYDFTVFTGDGDKITYRNTEKMASIKQILIFRRIEELFEPIGGIE